VSRGTGAGVTPEELLAEASRVEQYGYTEHVRFLRASADRIAALTAEVQRLTKAYLDQSRRGEEVDAENAAEVQRLRGVGMDLCNELLNYEPMLTDGPAIRKLVSHYVSKLTPHTTDND
jgi:hypothetical protein